MVAYCLFPIVLQGVLMVVDEGWFHRARGLPRWERIGHPIDTLTIAVCLAWLIAAPPRSPAALSVYVGLAVFSTLFVTKDETVHAGLCSPGEHWLHAILFVLHPVVLAAFVYLWWIDAVALLVGQLGLTIAFFSYQVIYWNIERADPESDHPRDADLGSVVDAHGRHGQHGASRRYLCDGSRDGAPVLVDEVRARSVRDRGSRAR